MMNKDPIRYKNSFEENLNENNLIRNNEFEKMYHKER
jgi:hypothetical protein